MTKTKNVKIFTIKMKIGNKFARGNGKTRTNFWHTFVQTKQKNVSNYGQKGENQKKRQK